jgi:hypothetical protein
VLAKVPPQGETIMRILTFTRLVGLAAIGGAVYVHKQRGGDWTLTSMRDTLHHLLATGARKLEDASFDMRRAQDRVAGQGSRRMSSDEPKPRTYSDLGKRDEPNRH